MPSRAPRVLAIHPGALGDLIIALPAFAALRAYAGPGRLALLVGDDLAQAAADFESFDDVLTVSAAGVYHGGVAGRTTAFLRAARAARTWRPSHAAVFKAAPAWAALAAASGAPVRAGLARGPGARLLTRPVTLATARHHADRYAAVVAALGGRVTAEVMPAPGWSRGRLPDALARPAGGLYLGLAPGGARNTKQDTPAKRWDAARYADLAAAMLVRHPDARIVLFGGPGDRAEADVVLARIGAARVIDLVGRTTLATARTAISALDLFVVNDSALLHLAATTATPTVAVFGPTDPRVLAPRVPSVHAVWSPARAAPCWDERTGRKAGCATLCCIDRVSVDAVLAAAERALGANSAQAEVLDVRVRA